MQGRLMPWASWDEWQIVREQLHSTQVEAVRQGIHQACVGESTTQDDIAAAWMLTNHFVYLRCIFGVLVDGYP